MTIKEKMLLIQLLLEDIRSNWGWENLSRDKLAAKLSMELADEVKGMRELAGTILEYEHDDGRYFRYDYPDGYIGMSFLHGLQETFHDKTREFRDLSRDYLTYPENRFSDWEEGE